MATAVIMPRQGQSVESCILVEWLARAGEAVQEGQPLANIETDSLRQDLKEGLADARKRWADKRKQK